MKNSVVWSELVGSAWFIEDFPLRLCAYIVLLFITTPTPHLESVKGYLHASYT
jgi:hypothetical protein